MLKYHSPRQPLCRPKPVNNQSEQGNNFKCDFSVELRRISDVYSGDGQNRFLVPFIKRKEKYKNTMDTNNMCHLITFS